MDTGTASARQKKSRRESARSGHARREGQVPPATARPAATAWAGYIAVGLACAALGSGGTYLALRPALTQAAASRALTGDAAVALGNTAFDQKNWPQAIGYYTQAIAAGTDTPDLRTDLGTSYRNLHQPQKALEQFAVAQRENPQHENSLLNQGIVYAFDLGDAPRALALWRQYLQRFPHGQHVADVQGFIAEVQAHNFTPANK